MTPRARASVGRSQKALSNDSDSDSHLPGRWGSAHACWHRGTSWKPCVLESGRPAMPRCFKTLSMSPLVTFMRVVSDQLVQDATQDASASSESGCGECGECGESKCFHSKPA